jgi:hypothetical protein
MVGINRVAAFLAVGLAVSAARPDGVRAQEGDWRISGGASQVWFGGGAADTTGGGLRLGPSASAAWSLEAERRAGRVWIGLALSYLSAGLEVSGSGVSVVTDDLYMRQFEIAALVSLPIMHIGRGAEVVVSAGPALDHWSVSGADSRSRFGALALLRLSAPISPDWTLLASAGGSLAGSPFEASELPAEFEPSTLWTGRAGFGVQVAF